MLGQLLKHVGENPSEAEVQDLRLEVDPATTGTFKFPDFLAMMLRKMDENSAEEDIRDTVQQFRYRYFRKAANMEYGFSLKYNTHKWPIPVPKILII